MLGDMINSMRTTQKWDVRDDRTAALLVKCRKGLPLLRPDHPKLPYALFFIADALKRRFEALGKIADIDDSITLLGESLAIPPSWHDGSIDDEEVLPVTALPVFLLGDALMLRFEHSKNSEDISAGIENYRMTLMLSLPDGALRQMCSPKLVRSLLLRFKDDGRKEDVDEAVQWQRELVLSSQKELDDGDIYESLVKSLSQLGNLLGIRYARFSLTIDLEEATESYEKALALLPNNDERRPRYLRDLAVSLHLTFGEKGQIKDLDGAIDRVREVIACLSDGNISLDEGEIPESLARDLNQLGDLLVLRYQKIGSVVNLEEETDSYGKALALLPNDDERRPHYLRDLAVSLHLIFEAKGQIEDLDGAIDGVREVIVCLSDGNISLDEGEILGSLAQVLGLLGGLLRIHYQKIKSVVDLEEATENYGKALALLPDNDEKLPYYLIDLAVILQETFEAKGQIEDLNGAIDRLREAIACLSSGTVPLDEGEIIVSLARHLNQLGDLLVLRYKKIGLVVNLEEATESYEKALVFLPDNSESRPHYLRDLATSLFDTFGEKGQIKDLDGAIDRMREALACLSGGIVPPDERETSISLCFLGGLLNARFKGIGEREDLDEAIQCQYQAMELDPTKRYPALGNLSAHLYALYSMTGDRSDLERALGFSREALQLCPVDDSSSRLTIKRHMAVYLNTRFKRSDRAEDLEEGLEIRRELVALTKGKDGHHNDVIDLVHSLYSQWRRDRGQLGAFDEGIQQLRDVLQTGGHDRDRMDLLDELANFMLLRHMYNAAPQYLEEAITHLRELMTLVPPGHIQRARHLTHLANALQSRFQLFRRSEDIDDAVDSAREAVPIGRDELVDSLSILAGCLNARSGSGLGDVEEAITVWQEVVSLTTGLLCASSPRLFSHANNDSTKLTALKKPSSSCGNPSL
ncbi:hypothetical protein EW026_g7848 [Hermanssonia centrifuga]|uniref:Uncharacterized protein n=1 Tax=Hermanssonia centrifuga TaxID=98765 RepID=A0A4S4KAS8_9APHY|nr:hypothetical protein EW026_g7848 [Hermanssonia centrifuga]